MKTLEESIAKCREMSTLAAVVFPEEAREQEQMALWLEELKSKREVKSPCGLGISICILTYNVMFYNKLTIRNIREMTRLIPYEILVFDNGSDDGSREWLESQSDVRVIRRSGDWQLRHGSALDYLVRHEAKYPIVCTLCSDAFPTSPEWLSPAFQLSDEVMLSGVSRGYGRITKDYVCPSYLFGWTEWLKKHSFVDTWPTTDTGENLTKECLEEGKKVHFVPFQAESFDGKFSPKNCNYNGLVWHVWWGGRYKTSAWVVGTEVEAGYHDFMVEYLRKKYNLDF